MGEVAGIGHGQLADQVAGRRAFLQHMCRVYSSLSRRIDMVKCTYTGCVKVAYYGRFHGRPTACEAHIGPAMGSVKRKCSLDGCQQAAFGTKTMMCERCARVYEDIESYKSGKMRLLADAYGQEASHLASASAVPPAAPTGTVIHKPAPSRPAASTTGATVPATVPHKPATLPIALPVGTAPAKSAPPKRTVKLPEINTSADERTKGPVRAKTPAAKRDTAATQPAVIG
jgi:hypothetical protein